MIALRNIYKRISARYHYASYLLLGANIALSMLVCAAILDVTIPFSYLLIAFPILAVLVGGQRRDASSETHLRASYLQVLNCLVLLCVMFLA
ncbi:MAG: hypothetical protein KGH65_04655 [Candidatus Micrarchaeota archaeon]|nr:hypothetical protein [Candidatus Micrarchaeota archaeon]